MGKPPLSEPEPFDDGPPLHTNAAVNLDGAIDDALRRFGREQLCHRRLTRDSIGTLILHPRGV